MLNGLRKRALRLVLSPAPVQHTMEGNGDAESYEKVLKQIRDFEVALKAMDFLLDDRTPQGTDLLKKESREHAKSKSDQPAAIFPLALGVMEFIEATLGFEADVMARAHKTLSEAEEASLVNSKYNAKHHLVTSSIYPPGTEFQVTYAELTLLNALVMLLQENNGMVEGAKALFKLRRAYQTLDSIYKKIKELEPAFLSNLAKMKKSNKSFSSVDLPGYVSNASSESLSSNTPEDIKLMQSLEKVYQMRKSRIEGTNIGNRGLQSKGNVVEGVTSFDLSVASLSRKGSSRALDQNAAFQRVPPINVVLQPTGDQRELSALNKGEEGDDEKDDSRSEDDDFSDANTYSYTDNTKYLNGHIPDSYNSLSASLVSIDTTNSESTETAAKNHLNVSTIDEFIHSGVQLCFGILQVVLSLIPPAIGKVLSIVGFKGDREVGLRMLWKTAISSRNIHGELALLCLLVFYDGPVQFIDVGFQLPHQRDSNVKEVLSIEDKSSVSEAELDMILQNPALYTPQILKKARSYFPHNALWVLQEGRMLAAQGQLVKAITLMQAFTDDPSTHIEMQQAEALLLFDRAMLYSFNHEYDNAAQDFIKLVDMNSWSRGLYMFMAGCCYLEKWRLIKMGLIDVDDKEQTLKNYSEKAKHYMKIAPSYVPGHGENAKKGGIGGGKKQMPFDKFLLRKMEHIENRKKKHPTLDFIDCVGTSPFHELIYFWNGYNRMTQDKFTLSLKLLGYSGAPNSEYSANTEEKSFAKISETMDESMIRYFLQSVTLRQLGELSQGLSLLDNHVISKYVTSESPQFKFTRMNYSPYLYPTALYEKTMFIWLLRTANKENFDALQAVHESKDWLKKAETVSGVGDYELSNRTSMRIKAAGERLDILA
ncbi:uncharacterized protein PRCAT00005891001 [Priceomyces carsonii]|uniref:uncharacterized protein n=1 Tax=Priceomyces carsonii TaxID=28549 RepID=UPI002ED90FA3|nr:unnamed protein product [Priceomyces carsonii]